MGILLKNVKNKNHHPYHYIGDSSKQSPKLDKLIADKISTTMEVDSLSEREKLKKDFKLLAKNDFCFPIIKNGYHHAYKILLHDHPSFGVHGQESLVIHFDPKDPTYNYLRAEWNPNKVSPGTIKTLLNKLLPNGGYDRVVSTGTLTRLDLSLQVHFCTPEDLLLYCPNIKKSSFHYGEGKLQTAYLGSKKGSHWVIYSKDAEIKEKNYKTAYEPYSEKEKHSPNYPITRFEYCFKPKIKGFILEDLKEVPNPFDKLLVAEHYNFKILDLPIKDKQKKEDAETDFRFFLDSCQVRGLQQALKLIKNNHRRTKYRKIVEQAKAAWWDSKAIGEQIPPLIKSLQNPIPKPLDFPFPKL